MVKTMAFLLPSTPSAQPRLSAPWLRRNKGSEAGRRLLESTPSPSLLILRDSGGPTLEPETFPQILAHSTDTGRH